MKQEENIIRGDIVGKNKPRHNPNKPQNNYGSFCQWYEKYPNGTSSCEALIGDIKKCKGNPHNCIKCKYHKLAITDKKNPNW